MISETGKKRRIHEFTLRKRVIEAFKLQRKIEKRRASDLTQSDDEAPIESDSEKKNIEVTHRYKSEPTIENYLNLRRSNPESEIEIATSEGIEFVLKFEEELNRLGIDPQLVCGVLDADQESQSTLSLYLLEKLAERRLLLQSGAIYPVSAGKAVGDAFVNYLIGACLDALSWNNELTVSRDLIVLIKHQLGLDGNSVSQEVETRNSALRAEFVGGQLISLGKEPSFRLVGKIMNVSASTVKRWFPNGDFRQKASRKSILFENWEMIPIDRIGKKRGSP